jgi:Flp pilus assembly protein TadD
MDLMAIGYWLALVPSLAALTGAILALLKFIRHPSAEWFLLLGLSCLVFWALGYMSLVIPAQVKAFYGLSALVPFCVFGALGADCLARRNTALRNLVCVLFGLWAINSYVSFWIVHSSTVSAIKRASVLVGKGQFSAATELLKQRMRAEPKNTDLQFTLAYFLTITGRVDESIREAETLVQGDPDNCQGHYVLALAFSKELQTDKALAELLKAMALAPGFDPSLENFTSILVVQRNPGETITMCRQALAISPYSAGLRLALGSTLLLQSHEVEGAEQLRYAYLLNPGSADTLAALAWSLATHPDPIQRNGTGALKLAEEACALTGYGETRYLGILAAVDAETGRFAEAINAAERAEAAALASGNAETASATRDLLRRLKAEHPNQEK